MTYLFLALFLAGLVLGVGAMLFGVERKRSPAVGVAGASTVGARLTIPNVAAFCAAAGAAGYLVHRYSVLGPVAVSLIAAGAGALGVIGASLLVARWALPGVVAEVTDERYLLQGHPARVTRLISDATGGSAVYEISYEDGGRTNVTRAFSLEGTPLEVESDVVIERIEDGAAYVEAWSVVEKRL